jgi:ketosteroid isomerase-like protein
MGAALSSVSTAYDAVARGRFDELAPLLAEDIDWRGLPDEDGLIPGCHGRTTALGVIQRGAGLAVGEVSVHELAEHENRVLATLVRHDPDGDRTHYVLVEVNGRGEIARLRAYQGEHEARLALTEKPR